MNTRNNLLNHPSIRCFSWVITALLTLNLGIFPLAAQTCVTAPSGLVSWWSAEGNALDNAGTNNGILVNGASFGPGEVGQAFFFNGNNQCVRVPDSPSLHLTNAIALEAWIWPSNNPSYSGYGVLVKYDAPGANGQNVYSFSLGSDLRPYIILSTNGTDGLALTANNPVPLYTWTHIAATYDGSLVSLYINGQLDNSTSFSGNLFPGTDDLGIGANVGGLPPNGMAAPFCGYIDEAAIYNRALSSNEIASIYQAGTGGKCPIPPVIVAQPTNITIMAGGTAGFNCTASGSQLLYYQWQFNGTKIPGATQPALTLINVQTNQSGPYLLVVSNIVGSVTSHAATLTVIPLPPCDPLPSGIVSWWSGETNGWDNLGGNNGLLVNGAGFVPGEVGNAFGFNGQNQCLRIPDAPNLHLSNALTLETWICPTSTSPSENASVFVKYGYPGVNLNQNSYSFSLGANGCPYFLANTNGISGSVKLASTTSIPTNVWTHLAGTFDGSQLKIYINGTLDCSTQLVGTVFPGTYDLGIGGNVGGAPANSVAAPFPGYMDEPAIYSRALSAGEIQAIYLAGPSGKCGMSYAPALYVQPTNVYPFIGNTTTLSGFASGSPLLNYQWCLNGTNIPGATNRTLALANLQETNTGYYTVAVSNSLGSIVSPAAFVDVNFVTNYGNGQPLTNAQYFFAGSVTIQFKSYYTNGDIFFTLDGTTPTPESWYYTGPFTLTNNAVIRTLSYSPDFQTEAISPPVNIVILPISTLTATTAGGGRITVNPSGTAFAQNTLVTITATSSNGWAFLQWQGDAGGTNATNSVLMSRNKSVQAVFGTTVSTSVGGGGSVALNPLGGIYPYGTVLQASAIPQPGNAFIIWGDAVNSSTNPLLYLVTTANPTIAALFTTLSSGQVSLAVVPVGHGTVSVNPSTNIYSTGQSVTITATPNASASFLGWSGNAAGANNPLTISLNQSKTIYANFTTNNSLSLRLESGQGLSEGVGVDLNGEMGTHYQLQASTNLITWTPFYNLTNHIGTLHFIDTNASNFNQRFYRSVILP